MIYTFQDKDTLEVKDYTMRLSELDKFKLDNPNLERYFDIAPPIGDPVRLGIKRNDSQWRELLQTIAKRTPGGNSLNDSIR